MKIYSDNTLLKMSKKELIEIIRCAEHNEEAAKKTLEQHIENVKDWQPVVRCKDCKHADTAYCHDHKTISKTDVYCLLLESRCKNNFYCADGERETHGTD